MPRSRLTPLTIVAIVTVVLLLLSFSLDAEVCGTSCPENTRFERSVIKAHPSIALPRPSI